MQYRARKQRKQRRNGYSNLYDAHYTDSSPKLDHNKSEERIHQITCEEVMEVDDLIISLGDAPKEHAV